MKIHFITFLLCFSILGNAQIVNIPDFSFKTALLNHSPSIDTNGDGEIQVSEAQVFIGAIWVNNQNISSLVGIEAFTSITQLSCSYNSLDSLNLSQNIALEELFCTNNVLSSLDISQNTALVNLDCKFNNLSSLDVSQNTALTSLSCNYNQLSTLDISQNTALLGLNCNYNQLSSLDASQNTALLGLSCNYNQLSSLDVSQNSALLNLACEANNIGNLNLNLNTALIYLNCRYNVLSNLDLTQNLALINLNCSNNNLGSVNLSQNTALEILTCNSSNLNQLDLSNNILVSNLECYDNNLTSLDVSSNTSLNILECSFNEIQSLNLPVSGLGRILCRNNQLTSIDLLQNTSLDRLWCQDNLLTSLDLSSQILLDDLNCSDNLLSYLDLRNGQNTSIFFFNISDNPSLDCVSVDDPIWSEANWTSGVDSQTVFSADCGNCVIDIVSTVDISCADSGRISTNFTGNTIPMSLTWSPNLNTNSAYGDELSVTSPGVYELVVEDSTGCLANKSVVISGPNFSNGFDLKVSGIAQGGFRPGLFGDFNVLAYNDGCIPKSGVVQLNYSGPITYVSSAITPPNTIAGNHLTWTFTDWTFDSIQFYNNLSFQVDSTANIGDLVCFTVSITPSSKTVSNNSYQYCYPIINSYDPNDKQVTPQGACNENYILANDTLSYTIRFQNTGNAEAINVYILDSLDVNLDVNSVRIISQSHDPLITEVLDSNVLKFRFDNIFLADSFSNEPESHGFVVYEIDPLPALQNGTEIHNRAAIYFDFNSPIITNTVFNTIIDDIPVFESEIFDTILSSESYTLANGNVVTEAGTYISTLPANNNCDSIVTENIFVKNTVGLANRLNQELAFQLYPNPATHSFTISISGEDLLGIVEVQNLLGQVVYTSNLEEEQTIISSEGWTDGMYHVLIRNLEGRIVGEKRLILMK